MCKLIKLLCSTSILIMALFFFGCAMFGTAERLTETQKKGVVHFKSGLKKIYERNAKDAIEEFDKGLELYPDDKDAILTKGAVYFDLGDYDKSIATFEQVLAIAPDYYQMNRMIWGSRIEIDDNNEAIRERVEKDIKNFKEEHPDSLDATYQVYRGLQFLKKDSEALLLLPDILRRDKKHLYTSRLANDFFYDAKGKPNVEKEKLLLSFLDTFPVFLSRRLSVYDHLLKMYRLKGDGTGIDDMVAIGHRWIKENPNNRLVNYMVAENFLKAGIRFEEVLKYLHRAVRLVKTPNPKYKSKYTPMELWKERLKATEGKYLDMIGYTHYLLGNNKKASYYFNKSLVVFKDDFELFLHKGMLYEKEGNLEAAYDAYLTSLTLGVDKDDPDAAINSLKRLAPLIHDDFDDQKDLNERYAKEGGITFFTDVTEAAGLADIKRDRVAWGDYNNDGYEDILVSGSILLENDNGRFTDVSNQAGLADNISIGGLWADFNNDGFLDFYMMGRGENGHKFMKNVNGERFENISSDYMTDKYFNEGAAWGDLDNDGLVDLYVANYEKDYNKSTGVGVCRPDYLWSNNGEGFVDVSEAMGVQSYYNYRLCGRGVSMADYDNDGKIEVMVSNYRLDPNNLWKSQDGKLVDVSMESEVKGYMNEGAYGHTIGSVWGDYDNDGDLDLFMANLAHPHLLGYSDRSMFLRNDDGKFVDIIETTGIKFNETDSDPTFADFDNDGDLDLYITSIYDGRLSVLYMNNGDGTFTDITWLAGVRVDNGWGNGFADYDNDGDLDLLVASNEGIRLFENKGNSNHWLAVDLGKAKGSGIGVRVQVSAGDLVQIREVEGGKGTSSQNSLQVEFGFGNYDGTVDIDISFPTGEKLSLKDIRPDQKLIVNEGGVIN